MKTYISNIIAFSISLFFNALKIIPGVNPTIVNDAVAEFKTGLDTAAADYAANPTEAPATVVEDMIHDGLQITKNALDASGKTGADTWLDEADTFDLALEKGSSPLLAALKAGWQKLFGKKSS